MLRHNIFFVDDDPAILRSVREILEQQYEVDCYQDGGQALTEAQQTPCDLLITDINMPKVDGIRLIKEFRKFFPLTPIIVLTGYGDVAEAQKAISLGANDFLEKPFDRTGFLVTIEHLLGTYDTLKQVVREFSLSQMQFIMLQHIIAGKGIKESAFAMNRSDRTLESHRYKLMKKMKANSAIEILTHPGILRYSLLANNTM